MRIGLLAPEENGKTSYLVALYSVLINDRNNDKTYPLKFTVKDPLQRSWFNQCFNNLVDVNLSVPERFPLKTGDLVTEYVFGASAPDGYTGCDVTIVDFPGGLLRGAKGIESLTLHLELVSKLETCDAFIVLLDSGALASASPIHSWFL
ncbi:hypothetical protein [Asticcacaulis sp. EMRT-3]|uniref:hypothetical protein n=1 Tax=Asticcacaulis sp. EMRT-3 TaxID=3040349 RepID=UPI0024AFE183|nr:hypothetical protein [Asticcacaulis sp. EMRT-3]MDI7774691.1 hypothetical protein [Asticcacaulis sp. EMRT-3]